MGLEGFARYQELHQLDFYPQMMGYQERKAGSIINTLHARMRIAKAFQGMHLQGYSEDTVNGYNSIFQLFLTYSAFEKFLALHSLRYPSNVTEEWLAPYSPETVAQEIRLHDKNWKFINFLDEHLQRMLKEQVQAFKHGETDNVIFVAAAIRHVFAHGHLTAYAKDTRPKIVKAICDSLSDFLLNFIDTEFSQNIERFYEQEKGKGLTRRIDRKKRKSKT